MKPTLLIASLVLFALGCDAASPPIEQAPAESHHHQPSGAACPDQQTLRYDNFGERFIAEYCIACHSAEIASDDFDFSSQIKVRLNAEWIDRHAAGGPLAINAMMPPKEPRPSIEERMLLGEWLACGAP